jgi:hypothetical protein
MLVFSCWTALIFELWTCDLALLWTAILCICDYLYVYDLLLLSCELAVKIDVKHDVACLFGTFGKYRNRTERTDNENLRYQFFWGTDRYRVHREPNYPRNWGTEPIGSVVSNAQGDLVLPCKVINQSIVGLSPLSETTYSTGHEIPNDGSWWILCLINCVAQLMLAIDG